MELYKKINAFFYSYINMNGICTVIFYLKHHHRGRVICNNTKIKKKKSVFTSKRSWVIIQTHMRIFLRQHSSLLKDSEESTFKGAKVLEPSLV